MAEAAKMKPDPEPERCTWCGVAVDRDDGYRVRNGPGSGSAVFCRLEHVVPWALKGARWEGGAREPPASDGGPGICPLCAQPLTSARVTLMRHRGEHRIPDAFCSVEHLAQWANAGGRYA